jgi:hypothetical protein
MLPPPIGRPPIGRPFHRACAIRRPGAGERFHRFPHRRKARISAVPRTDAGYAFPWLIIPKRNAHFHGFERILSEEQ